MNFNEACTRVREGDIPTQSIGVLKEKPLHAILKWWLDDNPAHHEICLSCGKVADVFDGTTVTEVQTGSFSPLRKKLEVLLPDYPVTVVHPVVRRKYLSWIHPETGETSAPRKSPRVGSFADGGKQLIYLLPLLSDESIPYCHLRPEVAWQNQVLEDVQEKTLIFRLTAVLIFPT